MDPVGIEPKRIGWEGTNATDFYRGPYFLKN